MAYILGRLGVQLDSPATVEEVLRQCQDAMRDRRRLLTDDEIRAIAAGR